MDDAPKPEDELVTEAMRVLGHRRWANKTDAEKHEHAMMMVRARLKAAKARAKKQRQGL